jgi:hypothetical protein
MTRSKVLTMQTGSSPKMPTLGVSGEVSEFDVGPISRLLLSTLPPGDSRWRSAVSVRVPPDLSRVPAVTPELVWPTRGSDSSIFWAFSAYSTLTFANEALPAIYADVCRLKRGKISRENCPRVLRGVSSARLAVNQAVSQAVSFESASSESLRIGERKKIGWQKSAINRCGRDGDFIALLSKSIPPRLKNCRPRLCQGLRLD